MTKQQKSLILHAVNIRVGGGLQVADSIIRKALKSKDFDRIFISPELLKYSDGSYKDQVEIICGRFRAFKLFQKIRSKKKKQVVYAIFGPTGVPKFFQGKNTSYVVGFATPWLIPSNFWYTRALDWKKRVKFLAKRLSYRLEASALVCEADYIKKELAHWSVPIVVAKNGSHQVFRKSLTRPSKAMDDNTKELTGLYVSAGYPHKNHNYLYEFARTVKYEHGISVKFTVTLSEEDYLSIYPQNDRDEFIKNVGQVPISRLPTLYEKADFVLVPSLVEASSAVIYEAIASEKLTFAFDLIFNREIGREAIVYIDQTSIDKAVNLFCEVFQNASFFEEKMNAVRILKKEYALNAETRYDRILSFLKNV